MSTVIEMRNIVIKVEGLINVINDDIEIEKYLVGERKEYLEEVNATIKPWCNLWIEKSEEKIKKLERYKKDLNEIKDSLENLEAKL